MCIVFACMLNMKYSSMHEDTDSKHSKMHRKYASELIRKPTEENDESLY